MQRSPSMSYDTREPFWPTAAMCPAGFMPMPAVLIAGMGINWMAWQALQQRAWQMAAAQPQRLRVTAADLPRHWRN